MLVSGGVMAAATFAKHAQKGGVPYQQVWAVGAIMVVLGLVADVAPQIAGPLAGLIALSTLTTGGLDAVTAVASRATGTASTGPAPVVNTANPSSQKGKS